MTLLISTLPRVLTKDDRYNVIMRTRRMNHEPDIQDWILTTQHDTLVFLSLRHKNIINNMS